MSLRLLLVIVLVHSCYFSKAQTSTSLGGLTAFTGTSNYSKNIGSTGNIITPVNSSQYIIFHESIQTSANGTAIVATFSGKNVTALGSGVSLGPMLGKRCVRLDDNIVVFCFTDQSNKTIYLQVGTVSGTGSSATVTLGTKLTTSHKTSYFAITPLSKTQFLLAWEDDLTNDIGKVVVGSISGTGSSASVSLHTSQVFENNDIKRLSIDTLSSQKFVIAYCDDDNDNGECIVGTVSGNSISINASSETILYSSSEVVGISAMAISSEQFVVSYGEGASSGLGKARIGTVSGTTITLSSSTYSFTSSSVVNNQSFGVAMDYDEVVIGYTDGSNGKYKVGKVSGSGTSASISFSSANTFATSYYGELKIARISEDEFAFGWMLATGSLTNYGLWAGGTKIGSGDFDGFTIPPEIKITGNSTEIVDGDVTPSTSDHTDFGSVLLASGTASRTYTIENEGGSNLNLGGSTPYVSISGTHSSDFSVSTAPSNSISASSSTTFTIEFDPSATGTRTATISISSDDADESPYTFDIEGEGVEPEIKITGNSTEIVDGDATPSTSDHTDFGSVLLASGTASRTYTIENEGTSTLNLSGSTPYVSISGTNSADFSVSTAPSNSISASSSTTFTIEFDPSATGTRTATISISSDDTDESPYTLDIEGEGVEPEIKITGNSTEIVDGDATPSTSDHTDFGSVLLVSGTASRTYTIENEGTSTLNLSGSTPYISISGTHSSDFSVSTAPSNNISASSSTTFTIEFDPSATGTRTATISVSSDDADESPYTFDIEGEGVEPEIKITGNSTEIVDGDATPSTSDHTDFGTVDISSSTLSRTFTIENTGTGTLNLSGSSPYVSISGTNAGDFSVTSIPSQSISVSSSTTFTIEFDPSAKGIRTAIISVSSNDADESPYTFDIEGEGTNPEIKISGNSTEIADGDDSPSITDDTYFGGVLATSGSVTKTFTIDNTGSTSLTLSGSPLVAISGTNSTDFTVSTAPSSGISGGSSTTFIISFDPSDVGERTAELTVASDDADEAIYNFSVSGIGVIGASSVAANTDLQMGSDIDADATGDLLGSAVASSVDGGIIAVAAPNNDNAFSTAGQVQVFQYNNGSWSQLGSDILGETSTDQLGTSVALSGDGTILAVGAPNDDATGTDAGHVRVYQYSSSTWSQLGSDIDGEAAGDNSGISVALSYDGSIVAIGADKNDGTGTEAGHVRVYEYSGSSWSQLGSDIDAEAAGDGFGRALSLSSNGKIIAIAARLNDGSYSNAGHVRILEFNNGDWSRIGSDIDGEAASDLSGRSVSISADGSIVAIGSSNNDGNGNTAGHVRVYQLSSGSWTQLGGDIDGENSGDESGFSVSLSDDGTLLAVGAPKNDGTGTDAGHVRLYQYAGSSWTKVGNDIEAEAAGDEFGYNIALSPDGTKLTIGARKNGGTGTDAGHVRVIGLAYAEISITGNGVEIVDGDATPTIKDHSYFGSVDATSATKTRTFTIKNTGSAGILNLESSPIVSISGTNSSDFTVSSQPSSTTVLAGGTITFDVKFDPSAEGTREAEITLTCNDLDKTTYNFSISGLGSEKANYPFDWTWVGGSDSRNQSGTYGTKGTASSSNVPGAREGAMVWQASDGTVYIFGGKGYDGSGNSGLLNDLWKWDGSQWTWLAGSNSRNQTGTYLGSSLEPGGRYEASGYIDASGNLWLLGGSGYNSSSTEGYLNDLWKWDGSSWTWEGGKNSINERANYGSRGTASSSSWPRGAGGSNFWVDGNGNFWLFGGRGIDQNNNVGDLNDLWKWNGSQWAYMDGDKDRSSSGTFNSIGNPTSSTEPSARRAGCSWIDNNGDLYLFGGRGKDGFGSTSWLNDLWKYDISTGRWTWMAGSKTGDQDGTYGTQGKAASSDEPGGRRQSIAWVDPSGNLILYGGIGLDDNGDQGDLADMWSWNGSNWAWISGSKTKDDSGNYGTLGVSSSDYYPVAKGDGVAWIDSKGALWMFAGDGIDANGSSGLLNDLWKIDMSFIWNGTSSTWNTDDNWKNGGVATSNYPVKIPGGLSSYPTVASDISLSDVEIEDGASLSIGSGNTLTIINSFEYKGSSALNLGDGTLKFNGSAAQTIDGKINGNVEIDNSNDVSLGATSTINNLTLTSGDLDIGNNDLTLGTATGGSSSSYIKISGTGTVTAEVGSSPVTLPIGRNPYEPIIIDDGGSNNYTVGVYENVYGNPVAQSNLQTSNVVGETWTIQASAAQSNVSVTVQWNVDEEETGFTRSTAYLSYWEGGVSSLWDVGASLSASGSGPYTLTRTVNFTTNPFYFGVGSAGSALPVELTYFNAEWIASTPLSNPSSTDTERSRSDLTKSALLTWATASETNNSHFEIQRAFGTLSGAVGWESIGQVQGQGTTHSSTNYSFEDQLATKNSSLETIYYRLKQVDFSGQLEYSPIRTLSLTEQSRSQSFSIYPNPSNSSIIHVNQVGTYRILSTTGKVLKPFEKGSFIDVSSLGTGSYIIENTEGSFQLYLRK